MITFVAALLALLLGYLTYGALVDRLFGPDASRPMPCVEKEDGVDFVPMSAWRVYLIQFLNIAGTGPIFGAIMGILFGPAAYLWIVFGCIFAGAVHDYLTGMISIRKGGASLPEIVGDELGISMRYVMRVFAIVLLILVGTVFTVTSADLLQSLTADWSWSSPVVWTLIILTYFVLATLLPISTLIGQAYPVFGVALLVMAVGVCFGIFTQPGWMPELTDGLGGWHPKHLPVFPMLCVTIACGAISGFHATQTPLMARCIKSERQGRRIFYGAMITEGVVALIWAAAAIKFAGSYQALADMGTPAVVVNTICSSWMGTVGAVLAVLGVVAAPITSGDTAFRSARLIVAEFLHIKQKKNSQPSTHLHPPVRPVVPAHDARFQCPVALLRLVQPDGGLHHAVGCGRVAAQERQVLLDCRRARRLHDGGVRLLHPAGARGLQSAGKIESVIFHIINV